MKTKSTSSSDDDDQCTARLDEASRCIRGAVAALAPIVISECCGSKNLNPTYRTELRTVLNALLDIRDKHFAE